ncbi:hypothetical protein GUJ93_ZPchr0002g23392 [Zizania palustris]|uniref:Uncharacterized protein n=1 Tax=Zizania palustris TaxID=103762 RepID=A0A8J5RCE3_ZIZPA|nr:hypothetical protein GUJ93_ZPchr0002g23392 [Zizania palustris]
MEDVVTSVVALASPYAIPVKVVTVNLLVGPLVTPSLLDNNTGVEASGTGEAMAMLVMEGKVTLIDADVVGPIAALIGTMVEEEAANPLEGTSPEAQRAALMLVDSLEVVDCSGALDGEVISPVSSLAIPGIVHAKD